MEDSRKQWLREVDARTEENALQIALLKQEVRNNHEAVMRNSDVRLEAIMERFDRLDKQEEQETAKKLAAKRLWIPLALTVSMALGGLVKLAYVDPLSDSLNAFDRRLKYVEQALDSSRNVAEPK